MPTAFPLHTRDRRSTPFATPSLRIMSHPLAPLRHVYDVEPPTGSAGDPATLGDPVETELLRGMRRVLDARPSDSPSESVIAAVLDRATSASASAQSLYDAYAASAPLTGEAELLRQSREVLDRARVSRPQPRPSDAVEALILARAADATQVQRDVVPESLELAPVAAVYGLATNDSAEAALLGSTRDALDRLPIHQPDASTLDAILAQAALASSPSKPEAIVQVAPDRVAVAPAARRRRMGGIWAGSAALVAVALIAVFAFPFDEAVETEAVLADASPVAAQAEQAPTDADADVVELAEESLPAASAPLAAVPPARIVQRTAPRGPSASDVTPVRAERRAASPRPASPSVAATPLEEAALADAASNSASTPEWDVSDDVRLLSLRLQELRRQNQGLSWDEPAEAFGAPAASGTTQPGIQAVREGAVPARALVRVRSDSARSN